MVKVILYATITPNGLIARANFEEDFLPDSGWEAFKKEVAETGNLIIGRHTYEVTEPEHFDSIVATRIVVSTKDIPIRPTFQLAKSPAEALAILKEKGVETALVAGGSGNNTSFMKLGLIDEIHLFVVPYIIGSGVPVFFGEFECQLKFIASVPFAEGFISKYRVTK